MVTVELDVDWPRAGWIAFGFVMAAILLYVLYSFVGTFVFAVFIYYATRRLYRRVEDRMGQPSLSALLSLVLFALPGVLLLYYALAIALQEFNKFVEHQSVSEDQFGSFLEVIEPFVELSTVVEDPSTLLTNAGGVDSILEIVGAAAGYIGVVGIGLIHLFAMFAAAFYMLRDGHRFTRWAHHFTDAHGVLEHYFREVDRSFDKVFYGNILNAIITGTIGAITFSVLNFVAPAHLQIPYPALTGLLTGVTSLIPVVGMKLVYVPLGLYLGSVAALGGHGWWFVGLFWIVSFIVVDSIPDLIVRPYVSGGSLHIGALMIAYVLGPLLWGWYGLFLAPMILVLVVHFVRIVLPELVAGTPIRPYTVDPSNVMGEAGTAPSDVSPVASDAVEGGGIADELPDGVDPGD